MSATIKINNNGPIRIEGEFTIVDSAGNEFPVAPGKPVSLCRCGQSARMPFCDGTHSKCGFSSVVVVPSSEGQG